MKMFMLLASVAPVAFMSETCETVLIKGKGGKPVRVNKSDYDADQADKKTMTLHTDDDGPDRGASGESAKTFEDLNMPPVAAPSAPNFNQTEETGTPPPIDPTKNAAAPVAPSQNQRLVSKEGTGAKARFYVVDGTGTKLTDDGIDQDGYKTEKEAWDAIMALPH